MSNNLETSNLHKVNHEESKSEQILSKEIQSVIRNLATKQSPGIDGFTGEFYKMLKRITIPLKVSLNSKFFL